MSAKKQPTMNTSQKIMHVFACRNQEKQHYHPGLALLRAGDIEHCPTCGEEVYDATDTPAGMAYFAHARPDLGDRP
jgi:hypothetical protein